MSTRDRILDGSLQLLNDAGAATVSTNRIANELDISPGNLYYHFKTKERIVESLIRRFEQRLEPMLGSVRSIKAADDLWLALHLTFEAVHAYRFLFRDVDYVMRSFPSARKRLQKITATALQEMHVLCSNLQAAGILRAEPDELEMLAFHIVFTATCWPTFLQLTTPEDTASSEVGRAAYQVFTLLTPYLNDDSRHYMRYLRSKYRG